MDQSGPEAIRTLCIDIGGTHVKAAIVTPDGAMSGGQIRMTTPAVPGPEAMVEALAGFVAPLAPLDRIAVGFPGAIRRGHILTAPNIHGKGWAHFPFEAALAARLERPVRLANDATVQGLGVIEGQGIECTITFGTGMGFALFEEGVPGPQMELGQHPARHKKTYDQYVGRTEHDRVGLDRWNRRVQRVINQIRTLVNYDTLFIGGGNASDVRFSLPPDVRIVANVSGIIGGIELWQARLDHRFTKAGATSLPD